MGIPRVFADFQGADPLGRIRLIAKGTLEDIARLDLTLSEGMELLLHDGEEFQTRGIVRYSKVERIWVAEVDWTKLAPIQRDEEEP